MVDYTNMQLLDLYERALNHVKPGCEDAEEIVAARVQFEIMKKDFVDDMREHLEILEECCGDATEPPWCGFSDDGKMYAIMAAGRPFDVFKFEEPPKDADAHYLLLTQPHVVKAMIERIRKLEDQAQIDSELRWTSDSKKESEDECGESSEPKLAE